MKKLFLAFFCLLGASAIAQNLTTISAANIQDINGAKLATGQLCFLITDQQDNPISVQIGGGGQALKRGYCSPVANGTVTGFTVPEPAHTSPAGIYYRVTVKDTANGNEVLRYTQVTFVGATFNFDNYAPLNLGNFASLTGNAVTGNLNVTGNVAATGTVTGSNIPGNILQQIFSSNVGQTQRTAVNFFAGLTCSDNAGTTRTDCRLGTLTTVTFSATPTFDASTASTFKLTLTGNVTSSTLSNAVAGQPIGLEICQDATGGRTFVAPANVVNFVPIPSAANACIFESFVYDGTNALADQSVAGLLISESPNVATAGVERVSSTDQAVCFRNNANGANVCLQKTGALASPFPADTLDATAFGGVKAIQVFGSNLSGQSNSALLASGAGTIGFGWNNTTGATDQKWGDFTLSASTLLLRFVNDANSIGSPIMTVGRGALSAVGAIAFGAGGGVQTLPTSTDTLVGKATTDTLTNKTLASPVLSGTASGNSTIPASMLQSATAVMMFSCLGTASPSQTLSLNYSTCTTGIGLQFPVGSSGTIKNFECHSNAAGVNASSGVMTVRKNGVGSAVTCTFGTTTACSDLTHSFSVVAGDLVDIIFTTQAAETLSQPACTIEKQ